MLLLEMIPKTDFDKMFPPFQLKANSTMAPLHPVPVPSSEIIDQRLGLFFFLFFFFPHYLVKINLF